MILKRILKKQDGRAWTLFIVARDGWRAVMNIVMAILVP
jgi:hypothetical protein